MSLGKDAVKQAALLARIELKEEELGLLSGQLTEILDFIDQLKELDVKEITPTSHVLPTKNLLREDSPGLSISTEKALKNSPTKEDNFFTVPKVIE